MEKATKNIYSWTFLNMQYNSVISNLKLIIPDCNLSLHKNISSLLQTTYHIVYFEFDKETFHVKRNEINYSKANQFMYYTVLLYGLKLAHTQYP
jgi:hypothetical protein